MSWFFENCVSVQSATATLWSDLLVPEIVRKTIADDPARFIRAAADRPLKISRETLVLQTELPADDGPLAVVVKQYNSRWPGKALAALFRPTKAARNWAKAEFLREHGVATPRPLLACRANGWCSLGGSFLVTEWVGGSENLHLFGWRIAQRPARERLRVAAACAERLGCLIGRMHAAGAVHRDLKAANFLVVEGSAGLETWLVDLDGLQIGRRIDLARPARDLSRLAAGMHAHPWVTRSLCLRFLRAYERQFPQGTIAWKTLWRAIAERTAQIVRRKQRRGERVL
jgi:tRNA A-37 threonylcarbamoyl transferase component Bud32